MGLFDELVRRATGGKDIQLPNESGSVDPRLPNTGQAQTDRLRSVGKSIAGAVRDYKKLRPTRTK